ncbi:hypothetical protein QE152_g34904 [Popillia japonica]|uniref:Uncharacterized protein n=1 Tax=Popillia japonica TaxID=7064 RepID=A0AAW1IT70_POPJA
MSHGDSDVVISCDSEPAEAWQKWRDTFELYITATELNSKPKEQKRALLLYVIGPVGYQIYETYKFNKEKTEVTAENILEAISTYYKPYKNTTYLRYQFFTESQVEKQTIDEYIAVLKSRANDCKFGDLEDDLVRDRLICGIRDVSLREKLLQADATLPEVENMCRSHEASKTQTKSITGSLNSNTLSASKEKQEEIREDTMQDPILQQVKQYTLKDWPKYKKDLPTEVRPYWQVKHNIYIKDDLLFAESRLLVPQKQIRCMINAVHYSHQGLLFAESRLLVPQKQIRCMINAVHYSHQGINF